MSFFSNPNIFGAFQARDDNGDPIPFAKLTFWEASTTVPAAVFADELFFVQLNDDAGELIADSDGVFPLIFMSEGEYRVRLETDTGILRWDISPYKCDCGSGAKIFRSPVFQSLTAPSFSAPSIGGVSVTFTDAGTGEPTPIYADVDRTVNLANPITADAGGFLPVIYLDDEVTYRVRINDDSGAELLDLNPYVCVCGTVIEYRVPGEYLFDPNFGGTDVLLDFRAIGAGAGGGSGSHGSAERVRIGGGGGGGGGKSETTDVPASSISGGVLITVGQPGVGGAAIISMSPGQQGLDGTDGQDSSVGAICVAGGGKRGVRGIAAGDGFVPIDIPYGEGGVGNVANGGDGGFAGGQDGHNATAGGSSTRGGGGGGGAGGKDSGFNYGNPADGGAGNTTGATIRNGGTSSPACQTPGGNGESTSDTEDDGGGGGGGAAPTCAPGDDAKDGGDGGSFGGGGGGGGMVDYNVGVLRRSGKGGNGAGGYVRVAVRASLFYRLTESGELRVTETGEYRVTEEAP